MTRLVGQITNEKECAYRDEVDRLTGWCKENNLTLNVKKTKEIIVDFRRQKANPHPLIINGEEVERTSCFKFLGVYALKGPEMGDEHNRHSQESTAAALLLANTEEKQPVSRAASVFLTLLQDRKSVVEG